MNADAGSRANADVDSGVNADAGSRIGGGADARIGGGAGARVGTQQPADGHRRRRRRSWVLGLRPRLVVAFVLVSLISGAAVAAASYRQARTIVLENTQDQFVARTRQTLETLNPTPRVPPDAAELQRLADSVGGLAIHGDAHSENGTLVPAQIPEALRRQVRRQDVLVLQRVTLYGVPYALAGAELRDLSGQPLGIEVYAAQNLVTEQVTIDQLGRSAALILALALLPAALLALGAAAGVLRPVRELRGGVRRLAAGQLETRLRPRGSDELSDLVRTFNAMAATLEANVGRLRRLEANGRRFVADVSHELRTPLTAMTAVVEALDEKADTLDGDAATAARMVSAETHRLRHLVENLIEISRFDAGAAVLRLEDADIAAVVQASLAARGWTDQVTVDLGPGLVVSADRRRLDVIVANLVGNALRHGAAPVAVRLAAVDDATVTLTVTDAGPGLPPETLPFVFDRFYKADAARTRSEGSGLGLAIAWENTRLHGGSLTAGNNPDAPGACFTLRLPRRPAPAGTRGESP